MPKLRVNLDKLRSFGALPAGEYVCRLTAVTEGESQRGNAMWIWDWTVDQGIHSGGSLRTWTVTEGENQGALKDHLIALGFSGKASVDTDKLLGKRALLSVQVVSREVNGEIREMNSLTSIRAFLLPTADDDDFSEDDPGDEEIPF